MKTFPSIPPKVLCLIVMAGTLTLTSGCGDGRPKRVPASGQVLYNGKPLTTGVIRVIPDEGRAATGQLDAKGRFTLSTYEANDGCLLGTHPVEILSFDHSQKNISIPLIPTHYNRHATSGLSVTIDSPNSELLFELSDE